MTLTAEEKRIYEKLPSALVICRVSDGELEFILASDGFYSLLGTKRNGELKADAAFSLHPEEREACLREVKAYATGEAALFSGYWRVLRPGDGKYQRIQAEGRKLIQEDGSELVFISCADGTEKFLEQVTFSRLTILGFEIIGILNPESGMCRYFRIKKFRAGSLYENLENYEESISGDIERIILPEKRAGVREALQIAKIREKLGETDIYPFVYSMTGREGKTKKKLLQFSYLDENRDTVFFCKSDITTQYENEQKQMDALRSAKDEADRANSEKSRFLSSMSHDIRTPLNGIIGFTYLALKEDGPVKVMDYLEKIRSSGELLLDLVNDTLELSRIESGKFSLEKEEIGSRALAANVLTALEPSAELKKIHFTQDLSGLPDETVRTDRLKVQKIILNLVSNAIKYTPAGGSVRAEMKVLDPPEEGCNICLKVSDTGIGISEEFQKRMFEPFSQEKRPEAAHVTGTGLGLAIVERYVRFMDGKIRVKSSPGRGTEFTVLLPVERAGSAGTENDADRKGTAEFAGKHILICEDNSLNAEIVRTILEDRRIRTDIARSGQEGLEKFSAAPEGGYDAILMDNRMPVMDGLTAARAIRALSRADARTVPIIAMSADAFEENIREAREAGMDDYITKPIDPVKVFAVIGRNLKKT